ncbi:MAG: GNAT family N-acetyltransferase [Flammeovirgaceae bacterium]|nr:GNAT family N-acetyltransferase [Flammeovirgaceae bacterium]
MKIELLSKLELGNIKALLTENKLPVMDISNHISFFGIKNESQLIGVVGLEVYSKAALLRSLVVADNSKGKGLGKSLCDYVLYSLKEKGVNHVYLLTTTAKHFFINLGFVETERNVVPEEILNTTEFTSICPSSAICLSKEIS